jgi:hypothetical protein
MQDEASGVDYSLGSEAKKVLRSPSMDSDKTAPTVCSGLPTTLPKYILPPPCSTAHRKTSCDGLSRVNVHSDHPHFPMTRAVVPCFAFLMFTFR